MKPAMGWPCPNSWRPRASRSAASPVAPPSASPWSCPAPSPSCSFPRGCPPASGLCHARGQFMKTFLSPGFRGWHLTMQMTGQRNTPAPRGKVPMWVGPLKEARVPKCMWLAPQGEVFRTADLSLFFFFYCFSKLLFFTKCHLWPPASTHSSWVDPRGGKSTSTVSRNSVNFCSTSKFCPQFPSFLFSLLNACEQLHQKCTFCMITFTI